ncbi:MAG TPA: hypothetical protein VGF34_13420 [Stellaceae bacterium]
MLKLGLWSNSVPRVELDHRARAARLRLENVERLLVPGTALTAFRFRRVFCLFGFGRAGKAWRSSRTHGPLSGRRPRIPQIYRGCASAAG